jgi:hypothetical protein
VIPGIIYRQPLPLAALPQIGEEAGAILVKMQKSPASDVEYPRPFLDKGAPRPEALQQLAQRIESARTGVLHPPFPNRLSIFSRLRQLESSRCAIGTERRLIGQAHMPDRTVRGNYVSGFMPRPTRPMPRRVRVPGSGTGSNSEVAPVTRQASGLRSLLSSPSTEPSPSIHES